MIGCTPICWCYRLGDWLYTYIYQCYRLDGRAGDSPVPDVTSHDRPLTHPSSGTSYASSVKKPESSVVPAGKAWESSTQGAPPPSPVCVAPGHVIGSYAAVLKRKGGPQEVSEPLSPSCEIDEILFDPGNEFFFFFGDILCLLKRKPELTPASCREH
jgi:hypothetical protein